MPILPKIALPLLSVFGLYVTYGLSFRNDTFALVEQSAKSFQLPGSDFALRRWFTGIGPIDDQLRVLLSFFWPVVNGGYPAASLRALRFAGQAGGLWMVILMEALRSGNQGSIISYTSAWGILGQNATFAVTFPLYWLAQLLLSPTASSEPKPGSVSISTADAVAIPLSVLLGYAVPAFLQCLKAPSYVSTETQQMLMAIWQAFPIWCAILQPLFRRAYATYGPPDTPRTRLLALRTIYATALTLCAASQIPTMSISFASSLFPSLFAPFAVSALSPARVWSLNQSLFAAHKVVSLGEGVLTFLQMDEATTCTATLIWAATMHWRAQSARESVTWRYWALTQAKILGTIPLGGPVAPAVLLLWERDEILLGQGTTGEKKDL